MQEDRRALRTALAAAVLWFAMLVCAPAAGAATAGDQGAGAHTPAGASAPRTGPARAACTGDAAIRFRGLTARLENDLIANTDRDYTNGISISAISHDIPGTIDPQCLPAPVRLQAALIGRFDPDFWRDGDESTRSQNVVLRFGQSMYTPGDPARTELITDDRPYAGLLYVGLSWNRRRLHRAINVETLDTREVTLGVIGPASLAREAQNLVHDLRGFDRFLGWGNQIHNEPALQVARERKYRDFRGTGAHIPGFSSDAIRSFGLRLGNIETSASYGIEGRVGWNLPNDFGSYPIRPGAENRPPSAPRPAGGRDTSFRDRAGADVFMMLEGKAVAHDFSLDGNLFRDSHRVHRRPLVGQAAVGLSVHGPIAGLNVKLDLMRVWRTREFDEQRARHAFGSIHLSLEF